MGYPKIEKRANELATKVCELWNEAGSPAFIVPSEGESDFINCLPESQKLPLLKALELCDSEIESLETDYGVTTISKKLQPIYRKALSQNSGVSQYRSLPLALFTYSGTRKVNEDSRSKVETATEKLIPVTPKQLNLWTQKAIDFLYCDGEDNHAIAKLSLGIAMLTGRRVYKEVCLQGEFLPILTNGEIDKTKIMFYGQAKAGEARKGEGYEIETLYDSHEIYNAHLDLLDIANDKEWYRNAVSDNNNSEIVQSVLHNYTAKIIASELFPIFLETVESGYPLELVAKDSRKIYATITHNNYVNRTGKQISFEAYAANLLGHQQTTKSGRKFKDTVTAQSYHKFSVVSGEAIPSLDLFWS